MRAFASVLAVVTCALTAGCGESSGAAAPLSPLSPTAAPTGSGMRGTVSDTAHRTLAGALVEVLTGPHAGLTTRSDSRGQFSFAGTFDDTSTFQAALDGFAPAVVPLGPHCERCNPQRWAHFSLVTLAHSADIAGHYTMTIAASAQCANLPDQARLRTYQVTMPRTADASGASTGYAWVPITGADVGIWSDGFQAGVSGDRAGFWFETPVERIAPDTYVAYNMAASATVTKQPAEIVAVADGRLTYCEVQPGGSFDDCFRVPAAVVKVINCDAGTHSVIFSRR